VAKATIDTGIIDEKVIDGMFCFFVHAYIYMSMYLFMHIYMLTFLVNIRNLCIFQAAKEANEGTINNIKDKEMNKNNDDIKDKKNINEEKTSKLNKRGRNVYENIDPRFMEGKAGVNNDLKNDEDTLYALLDDDNEGYNIQGDLYYAMLQSSCF
jgi:hypothetical protein